MQFIASTAMTNSVRGLMPRIPLLLLPFSRLPFWTNLVFSVPKKKNKTKQVV